MPRLPCVGAVCAGLSSSGLVALAAPGQDHGILAWVALIPLLFALRDRSPRSSFWLAFLSGLVANAGIVYWVAMPSEVRLFDFLLIVGYLGLWWGLFGTGLAIISKRQSVPLFIVAPVLWVTLEYVRSHFFFLELPWVLFGHTQYRYIELIQVTAIAGVYGLSFVIVLVNAAVTETLSNTPYWRASLLAAFVLVTGTLAFAHFVLGEHSQDRVVPVTIVPGNVPQTLRWERAQQETNLARYVTTTRRALAESSSALVVWPETSVPGQLRRELKTLQVLQEIASDGQASLLIGSADREKFGQTGGSEAERYNSAFLFTPNESELQTYYKMKLLPFGEYLPIPNAWFWPQRYRMQSSHYSPGRDLAILHLSKEWASTPFAVSICWESIFPDHIRSFVQGGAQFLVTISNEAWFSGSAASDQLLAMNVFRAVEYRRTLVRSVNGGRSGIIDPYGRILAMIVPQQDAGDTRDHLTYRIPVTSVQTLYAKCGDLFAQMMVALTMAGLCVPLRRARTAGLVVSPGMAVSEYVRSRQDIS